MNVANEYQFQPKTISVPIHEFTKEASLPMQVMHFLEQIPGYYRFGQTTLRVDGKWVWITYTEVLQ